MPRTDARYIFELISFTEEDLYKKKIEETHDHFFVVGADLPHCNTIFAMVEYAAWSYLVMAPWM